MDRPAPDGVGPVTDEIATLTGQLATENNGWGTSGSRVSWSKLGHRAGASAIRRVLKALRIPPAPTRRC